MTITFGATAIPEPSSFTTEWVTVAADDRVYRQLVFSWAMPTPAQAATILSQAMNPAGVAVTFPNPATNGNSTLTFKLYTARAPLIRETGGAPVYADLALTFREVLP